ncbi:M50 family metallopeptidase [Streptacidiphilus sp. PB12-B1b]|uniref:M50 family metallopeptidase n=1 Tax=Streptacidiphilus sp. PB12-B1b TaxID=2705012 RepID=UPI0015FB81C9|nr:M50 family metallopeptidase [Streptacidiphilus sp. PB12-B1b]QMU75250.1 M50 family metallopeptidase [Streptacidiphilus sp. PB12-B1b]
MQAHSISAVWSEVTGVQAAPDQVIVWATAAVALLAVGPAVVWHYTRNVVTIAHEGGHGLVAVLTRRRLHGIRLHSDTSGLTVSSGRPHGPGMVLTAAAGYSAPPLLGLGGAWLLSAGHVTALLWAVVALLLAVLVMVRNAYGALTVVVTGGVCLAVSWFGGAALQGAFAYLSVWFLLLAGVRPVLELQGKRRRGGARDSDADQLGRLTGTPPVLWVALFLVIALAALATGGRWLLTR